MHTPTFLPAFILFARLALSLPHTASADGSSFDERDILGSRDLLDSVGGTAYNDSANATSASSGAAPVTPIKNPKNPLYYAPMASAVVKTNLPPPTALAPVDDDTPRTPLSLDDTADSFSSDDTTTSTDDAAPSTTDADSITTTVRHGRVPLTITTPAPSPTNDASSDEPEFLTNTDSQGHTYLVKNPKYVQNPKFKKTTSTKPTSTAAPTPTGCFPAQSLAIPNTAASASQLSSWWCNQKTEYAFMGFSYDQTPCQSYSDMLNDFKKMKSQYKARYVRLYGFCDNSNYLNDMVNAAAGAGIGVYALVWFGFDGSDIWKTRMNKLVSVIKSNPKASWVIRNIALGSELLFDWVMSQSDLAVQINKLRSTLSQYGTQITMSEMPYGFQSQGDAPDVFKAIDIVEGNVLPFFDSNANWGGNAWGVVSWSISYFQQKAPGKVIRLTQTGWPSNTNIWKANTPSAISSVDSEKAYFDLLNSKCTDMKSWQVGWFAHIWADYQLDGWGLMDWNGNPKFAFAPKITC